MHTLTARRLKPPRRLLSSEDEVEKEEEEKEEEVEMDEEDLSEQDLPSPPREDIDNDHHDILPRFGNASAESASHRSRPPSSSSSSFRNAVIQASRSQLPSSRAPRSAPSSSFPPRVSAASFGQSAASAISAASVTTGTSKRSLHDEIARLHSVLGLQSQEIEVVHESLQAKENLVRRLQTQNDDLLAEGKRSRTQLKRYQEDKLSEKETLQRVKIENRELQNKVHTLEQAAAAAAAADKESNRRRNDSPLREGTRAVLEEREMMEKLKRRVEAEGRASRGLVEGMRGRLERGMEQLRECLETIENLEGALKTAEREKAQAQEEVRYLMSMEGGGRGGGRGGSDGLAGAASAAAAAAAAAAEWKTKAVAAEARAKVVEKELSEIRSHRSFFPAPSSSELMARCRDLEALLAKSKEVEREALEDAREEVTRLEEERRRLLSLLEGEGARANDEAKKAWKEVEVLKKKIGKLEGKLALAVRKGGREEEELGHTQHQHQQMETAVEKMKQQQQQQQLERKQAEAAALRKKCRDYLEAMNGVMDELERMKKMQQLEQQQQRQRQKRNIINGRSSKDLLLARQALDEAERRCHALAKETEGARRLVQAEQDKARELEAAVSEAAERIVAYEEEVEGTRVEMRATARQLQELQVALEQQREQEQQQRQTKRVGKRTTMAINGGVGKGGAAVMGGGTSKQDQLAEVLMRTAQQLQRATRTTQTLLDSANSANDATSIINPYCIAAAPFAPASSSSSSSSALHAVQNLRNQIQRSQRQSPIHMEQQQEQQLQQLQQRQQATRGKGGERDRSVVDEWVEEEERGEDEGDLEGGAVTQSLNDILQRCRSLKAELLTAVAEEEEDEGGERQGDGARELPPPSQPQREGGEVGLERQQQQQSQPRAKSRRKG